MGSASRRYARDLVERRVDVGERLLQRLHVEHRARRLLVDLGALRLEALGGSGDHLRRGGVDRLDLVEHDLLVGERQGHGDRDLQRTDGHVEGAVDTADEFTVVADDDLDRQHALLVDRQLLLQVERALAEREEDVLLDELAARVVGADLGGELVDHGRVERLGERDLVGQRVGEFAHLLLVVAERRRCRA